MSKTTFSKYLFISILVALFGFTNDANSQKKKKDSTEELKYKSSYFTDLSFRSVGPALMSGRVADIAVNPDKPEEYYLAIASGGVWKTVNAGTTYEPIFDGEGSYSTGCVTIDPNNDNVIWVGTGENNNQRSVAFGDGVYKSLDRGSTWKNMGLENSEHISKVIVHPDNSDKIYVAAYGPLWNDGGDRGIYESNDGGKTWENILMVDKYTGFSDLVMDPRNPNIMYAAAHQRMRHVFTYIGGGPSSGMYKTVDGGATWNKINSGLPKVDMGRIGLAISPADPNYLYAIVEASQGKGGFFLTTNGGASWDKRSKYTSSGNYYQEIVCDPKDPMKIFSMNTWLHHSVDGGKTFNKTGEKSKHVDNHCMWINPDNGNHWRIGCDGGVYETWDAANTWQYKANLPITQFYKVSVDNDYPFYNIYGGTQDNNSIGGPSANLSANGIPNDEWYITNGGDGFETQVDPTDPNIVYSQSQYGWLVRFDKKSGERVGIKPIAEKGEPGLRWNWDAPLLISPHDNKRLYFAANKLFRSDDRGESWQTISPDLTQQLDRNKMKIMGQIWSIDAVMKSKSTTIFGNIVALDESPMQEDLLYIGTDDGLIQISNDSGKNWTEKSSFPGVPAMTYVNQLKCSQHDANKVYAVFNNHKKGDYKPYILRSNDKGQTWKSITGNLPKKGTVYTIEEDHVNPNILFCGTEYGVFVTLDGGKEWSQIKGGLPTIAVRDMEIQDRENDLVLGTFGRSFYVLDDYSSLREIANTETFNNKAHIFDIKKGNMFIPSRPLGGRGKSSQGESYFTSPNPDYGSRINYFFKDSLTTLKKARLKREKKTTDDIYPTYDEIRAEADEEEAYLLFVIEDSNGDEVQKIKTKASAGLGHVMWNHRYTSTSPIKLKTPKLGRYSSPDVGQLALPGNYIVEMFLSEDGVISSLDIRKSFTIEMLNNHTLPATDKEALLAFQKEVAELRRSVSGSEKLLGELSKRLKYAKTAIQNYPNVDLSLMTDVKSLEKKIKVQEIVLNGDWDIGKHEIQTYPSINDRIGIVVWGMWNSTSKPSKTFINSIATAREEYAPVLLSIQNMVKDVEMMESKLDQAGVPYTPGRDENWKEE